MKKGFLVMTVLLCMMVAGCESSKTEGSVESTESTVSIDEMRGRAKVVDANEINEQSLNNQVRAKSDYCNQTLLLTGEIKTFGSDYVEVVGFYGATYIVDVYLPVEDMYDLETGQLIVVLGDTTDTIVDGSENASGMLFENHHYQMPVAFLESNTVELEGVISDVNVGNKQAQVLVSGRGSYSTIYFDDNTDMNSLKADQQIKFSAKAIHDYDKWEYRNAVVLK